MKGRRIFEKFGFKVPKQETELAGKLLFDFKEWFYDAFHSDWIEIEGELNLTNYTPSLELTQLLEKEIEVKYSNITRKSTKILAWNQNQS